MKIIVFLLITATLVAYSYAEPVYPEPIVNIDPTTGRPFAGPVTTENIGEKRRGPDAAYGTK